MFVQQDEHGYCYAMMIVLMVTVIQSVRYLSDVEKSMSSAQSHLQELMSIKSHYWIFFFFLFFFFF